jgi:hypothetical protein
MKYVIPNPYTDWCTEALNENNHLKQFIMERCKAFSGAHGFFRHETDHMNGLIAATSHNEPSTFFEAITDSEINAYEVNTKDKKRMGKNTTQGWLFDHYLSPALQRIPASEDDLISVFGGLDELFKNSIIHGNKAGNLENYNDKRHLTVPSHLEANKSKPIIVRGLITPRLFIFSTQDTGSGYNLEEKTQLGEGGNIMATSGRGLFFTRQIHNLDLITYSKDNGFVVSAVKYFTKTT